MAATQREAARRQVQPFRERGMHGRAGGGCGAGCTGRRQARQSGRQGQAGGVSGPTCGLDSSICSPSCSSRRSCCLAAGKALRRPSRRCSRPAVWARVGWVGWGAWAGWRLPDADGKAGWERAGAGREGRRQKAGGSAESHHPQRTCFGQGGQCEEVLVAVCVEDVAPAPAKRAGRQGQQQGPGGRCQGGQAAGRQLQMQPGRHNAYTTVSLPPPPAAASTMRPTSQCTPHRPTSGFRSGAWARRHARRSTAAAGAVQAAGPPPGTSGPAARWGLGRGKLTLDSG